MIMLQNKILRSMFGGAIGGFLGWLMSEPFMLNPVSSSLWTNLAIFGALNGVALGVVLGAAEGLSLRSVWIAIRGVMIGAVIGFFGGGIGSIVAQMVYAPLVTLCALARGTAWNVFGFFLGLSEGARRFSFKGTRNAAFGGILGGMIGGILFDWVGGVIGYVGGGTFSRGIGLIILGACIGILIAVVEQVLAEATLVVVQGRQEGRTILLDKPRTVIGHDERNDVYMSDAGIERRHAEIRAEGKGYAIAPLDGPVTVNQTATRYHILHPGDQIALGAARLVYRTRRQGALAPVAASSALPTAPPRAAPWVAAPKPELHASAADKMCPRCAHMNRPHAKFCQGCGMRL